MKVPMSSGDSSNQIHKALFKKAIGSDSITFPRSIKKPSRKIKDAVNE